MKQRLLVPLDGSANAERIFPWLRFLNEHLSDDSEIVLLRSFEPPSQLYLLPELSRLEAGNLSDDSLAEKILDYLSRQKQRLDICKIELQVAVGDAADEILTRAGDFDLILMASHGRGGVGRWLLGSVATKVVRAGDSPVLIVGGKSLGDETTEKRIRTILVPVDGSSCAEKAYELASSYAAAWDADVWLYRGVSEIDLDPDIARDSSQSEIVYAKKYLLELGARHPDLRTFCEVRTTYSRSGILSFAKEKNADLIVMGSTGKSNIERWMLGSETEHALRHSECPILVVPRARR